MNVTYNAEFFTGQQYFTTLLTLLLAWLLYEPVYKIGVHESIILTALLGVRIALWALITNRAKGPEYGQ